MVDLRDLALNHKAQVMQQHIVFSTAEVVVQVVRRLAYALDTSPGACQFFAQPLLLAQIQRWRTLQLFEQDKALGFVIGGIERHRVFLGAFFRSSGFSTRIWQVLS